MILEVAQDGLWGAIHVILHLLAAVCPAFFFGGCPCCDKPACSGAETIPNTIFCTPDMTSVACCGNLDGVSQQMDYGSSETEWESTSLQTTTDGGNDPEDANCGSTLNFNYRFWTTDQKALDDVGSCVSGGFDMMGVVEQTGSSSATLKFCSNCEDANVSFDPFSWSNISPPTDIHCNKFGGPGGSVKYDFTE